MNDIGTKIQKMLTAQLEAEGFDLDLVPIPAGGDRMVRIRTLEDALDDFDADAEGGPVSYLVQVRPKGRSQGAGAEAAGPALPVEADDSEDSVFSQLVDETFANARARSAGSAEPQGERPAELRKPSLDGIYLPSGKLNLQYLQRNAELLFSTGEYALSRNIYTTILQSGERAGVAHFWIGKCFEAEGKLDEARKRYDEAIAYLPTIEAYQSLGSVLVRLGRDQEAAETLERALHLKELKPATRFELLKACGNAWMRAEKAAEAEKCFQKALELEPGSDVILANLGALALKAERVPEARRCFEAALAANPKNDKAHCGLGSCHLAQGDKRAAHDAFARSLDLEPNNATAVFYLVKCAYELKTYATAARLVSEYVQIAPVNTNLLYSLAGLQYHLGRMDEARSTITRILELQPSHPGAGELQKLLERYP